MNWAFDELNGVWNLLDNSSTVARIFVKHKEKSASPFRTKTLIASVYTGASTFSRLTRKNKEWKVCNRKFRSKADMEIYIKAKKVAVQKMLENI